MAKLNKKQSIILIESLFRKLPELQIGWTEWKEKLYQKELAAEKQHRSGRTAPKGFSISLGAQYFVIQHLTNKKALKVVDILNVRAECIYAQALAVQCEAELKEWSALVAASDFNDVDYVELMK